MAQPVRRRDLPLRRWDMFQELEDLYDRMGHALEGTFGGLTRGNGAWAPPVDMEETDDAFLVEADLPGVSKDDITVEIQNRDLVVTGEVQERERTGTMRWQTRRVGRFDYRVTLPMSVDAENIEATLSEGVLSLRIPKKRDAESRRVEVRD